MKMRKHLNNKKIAFYLAPLCAALLVFGICAGFNTINAETNDTEIDQVIKEQNNECLAAQSDQNNPVGEATNNNENSQSEQARKAEEIKKAEAEIDENHMQEIKESADRKNEEYLAKCKEESKIATEGCIADANDDRIGIAYNENGEHAFVINIMDLQFIILYGFNGSPTKKIDIENNINIYSPLIFDNCDIELNLHSYLINRRLFGVNSAEDNGEAICIKNNAKVHINGDKTTLWWNDVPGYNGFDYTNKGNYSVRGSVICAGSTNYVGGGVLVEGNNNEVTFSNLTFMGCASYNEGGCLAFAKETHDNTVRMNEASIERCMARDHGAAIANMAEANNNSVIFKKHCNEAKRHGNCGCFYNYANRYGGAIFTKGKSFMVSGDAEMNEYGKVDDRDNVCFSHNEADRSGGVIEIQGSDSNVLLQGINMDCNKANGSGAGRGDGGAVDHCNGNITVANCNFRQNHAHCFGGACYIGEDGTFQNCCIKDNTSESEGGGIFVAGDDTLNLSEFIYCYDNHGSNEAPDMYISTKVFRNGYIGGNVSVGSWIGINVSDWRTVSGLSEYSISLDENCFFSTKKGYKVYCRKPITEDRPDPGTNRLYWGEGEEHKVRKHIAVDDVKQQYTVTSEKYNGQDVFKGTTQYRAFDHNGEALGTYFYYSDGYFADVADKYNEHMATCSLALASASGELQYTKDGQKDYSKQYVCAQQFLSNIGCEPGNIAWNESYQSKPTADSIGVICGSKDINVNGEKRTLIPVSIRGIDYEQEWISNFMLGTEGDAAGFSKAGNDVRNFVLDYIKSHNLNQQLNDGKITFWIVGHSRAGATSMLAAKYLTEEYAKNGNSVRAYTFEAPLAGIESNIVKEDYTYDGKYCNIHNVINREDVVPKVAPAQLGFIRYGLSHYVPGTTANNNEITKNEYNEYFDNKPLETKWWADNSPYSKKYQEFIKAFCSTNPYIKATNYFYSCNIKFLEWKFLLGTITETAGDLYDSPTFTDEFVKVFTERELKSRDNYCSPMNIGGKDYASPQEALTFFIGQIMGKSSTETAKFADALQNSLIENVGVSTLYFTLRGFASSGKTEADKAKKTKELVTDILKEKKGFETIGTYFKGEELEKCKYCLPTMVYILFDFLSDDYNTERHGCANSMFMATMITNMENILITHYPEACLGWLKVYDSYYINNKDLDKNPFHLIKSIDPVMPKAEIAGKSYDSGAEIKTKQDECNIKLSSPSNDGMIYYTIGADNNIPEPTRATGMLYKGELKAKFSTNGNKINIVDTENNEVASFDAKAGKDQNICIKAVNLVYGNYSPVASFNITREAPKNVRLYSFKDDLFKIQDIKFNAGDTVDAITDETYTDEEGNLFRFKGWQIKDADTQEDITEVITHYKWCELTTHINFYMPNRNIIVDAKYEKE